MYTLYQFHHFHMEDMLLARVQFSPFEVVQRLHNENETYELYRGFSLVGVVKTLCCSCDNILLFYLHIGC